MRYLILALLLTGCYPTAMDEWHLPAPYGDLIAATVGVEAVTIPVPGISGIIIDIDTTECGMVHERAHLAQIKRLGDATFVASYAAQTAKRGYRMNCLEIEAYSIERECLLAQGMDHLPQDRPVNCVFEEGEDCGCRN